MLGLLEDNPRWGGTAEERGLRTRWGMAGLAVALITLPLQGIAASWGDLLDAAWQRSAEAQSLAAREPVLQARRADAQRWLPTTPELSVSHRSDQWHADEGAREWEVELEAPLWRQGQRKAQAQSVGAEAGLLERQVRLLQWNLAGELREQVWQLVEREAQLKTAQARVSTAEALQRDVERRVAAGDLAQADALLAQSETFAAGNELDDASLQVREAQQKLLLLSGQQQLPSPLQESPQSVTDLERVLQTHPRFQFVQQTRAAAIAEVSVARQSQAPLSAGLLWAQNREALDDADRQSVGVKVTLPLGAGARQRSTIAAAQAERVNAEAQAEQARREIEQGIELAKWAMQNSQRQREQAERQYAAAQQSLALSRRAFDAGELDLSSLLRLQQNTLEALEQRELKRIASERAVARFNQALGALP